MPENTVTIPIVADYIEATLAKLVGFLPSVGMANDVVVRDGFAFLATETFGLSVVDVSNPSAPTLVSTVDRPFDGSKIALSGSIACVTGYRRVSSSPGVVTSVGGFYLIDISDPAHPRLVGSIEDGGYFYGVAISGNYAYVARGFGVSVINISNPTQPTIAGSYATPGGARSVTLVGNYAYVADSQAGGLRILNVSNPTAPVSVGWIDTPGNAQDVAVVGSFAYVADFYGLQIVDISNPQAPSLRGHLALSAFDVKVQNGVAYVAAGSAGLIAVDVTNPDSPIQIGGIGAFGALSPVTGGVFIMGNLAYVANSEGGLGIANIENPSSISQTSSLREWFLGAKLTSKPGLAIMTGNHLSNGGLNSAGGLRVINTANPAAPIVLGQLDDPSLNFYGAAISGDYVYVTSGFDGIKVIDISNPAQPTIVGSYDTPGGAQSVSVVGNYAYVADGSQGLRILDISNPTIPVSVGWVDTPGNARHLTVVGSLAYVADFYYLQIVDVSNPQTPVLRGSLNLSAMEVKVENGIAYVAAASSGLVTVDVSNPDSPNRLGSIPPSGAYNPTTASIGLNGSTAYVANGDGGLAIIDVSNPASLRLLNTVPTLGYVTSIIIDGHWAYLADSLAGINIIDVEEADFIRFWLLIGNYLYGLTDSTPAKIIRINKANLADRTTVTFTDDGNHGSAAGLVYAQSAGMIYALFGSASVVLTEIHPSTLVLTDKITGGDDAPWVGAGADCMAADDTYLFILWGVEGTEFVSRIVRYVLADLRGDNFVALDLTQCGQALKCAGGSLYVVSLINPLPSLQKINATNFGAPIVGMNFPAGTAAAGMDVMEVSMNHVFVTFVEEQSKLWRFAQTGLAVTELAINSATDHVALASDGAHIWDLHNDGLAVRIDPYTGEQRRYTLQAGQGYFSRIVGEFTGLNNTYLYAVFFATPTQIARYNIPRAAPGELIWVNNIPCQNGNAIVTASAIDASGNVIVAGYFNGTIDLGEGPVNSRFSPLRLDIFIIKYDASGQLLWKESLGGNGHDSARALAVDASGNIFLAGNFQETVDFGGGNITAIASTDLFIVKFSADGAHVWSTKYNGITIDIGSTLAADAAGDLFVAGICQEGSDVGLGPIHMVGSGNWTDIILAKLSGADGSAVWAEQYGGPSYDYPKAIAVHTNGNIAVAGYFNGSINLGGGSVNSAGSFDAWLALYSGADGDLIWSKRLGSTGADYAYGAAFDASGNVIVTGNFQSSIDLGGGLEGAGLGGVFVAVYDAGGNYLWSRTTGTIAQDAGTMVRASGSAMGIGGRAVGGIDFGGGYIYGNGQPNSFNAIQLLGSPPSYPPSFRWANHYGAGADGVSNVSAMSLAGGALVSGGSFSGTINFGGITHTAAMAGYSSAYVAKYGV